jgi:hypothetical protein
VTESDFDRMAKASRQATEVIRRSQGALPTAMLSPALTEAMRNLGKLNLGSTTALAEAAKAYLSVRPVIGPDVAEAAKNFRTALVDPTIAAVLTDHTESIAKAVQLPELQRLQTELVGPHFAEAMKNWQVPRPMIVDVSDAIRKTVLAPKFQIGPLAAEAVRRAAEVAEDPTATRVANEAVASLDLDHASRRKRRALQANVAGAIGALAAVVALLIHSRRLDLAAAFIWLIAYLIAIYGLVGDE